MSYGTKIKWALRSGIPCQVIQVHIRAQSQKTVSAMHVLPPGGLLWVGLVLRIF
jgi:hypothetical protein